MLNVQVLREREAVSVRDMAPGKAFLSRGLFLQDRRPTSESHQCALRQRVGDMATAGMRSPMRIRNPNEQMAGDEARQVVKVCVM